jgi:hypothetical protein
MARSIVSRTFQLVCAGVACYRQRMSAIAWWRIRVLAGAALLLAAMILSPWEAVSQAILYTCDACGVILLYRQYRRPRRSRQNPPPVAGA